MMPPPPDDTGGIPDGPGRGGVFISYRREDSAGYAGRLYDSLVARTGEDRVFMDVDNIEPGVDFVRALDRTLVTCGTMLAVIGRRWISSGASGRRRLDNDRDFVRMEIRSALDRGIKLIPILVDGARMPQATDLPDEIRPLAYRHAFEMTDRRWREDMDNLVARLEAPEVGSELDIRVAGYRILSTIGRGAMSEVYLAFQDQPGRRVALKVMKRQLSHDPLFAQQFLHEATTAASIRHPNILPVYWAGRAGEGLCLAARYVAGGNLAALLADQRPLPPQRALAIAEQVGQALDELQRLGLAHRAVQPTNILVAEGADSDPPGHAYLTDFGMARQAARSWEDTPVPGVPGPPPRYVAPELIAGGTVTDRADQYSLGCVLFECLTGVGPFDRHETEWGLLFAHMSEVPATASTLNQALRRSADAVLAKALAKQPADRFDSAGAFIGALSRALGP